ncbi:LysR family transcriptional regulator [Stella humosa]|uniref:LysR family transcriptional regulator n=1 Tax=Stella humosa TaxID=94 RepID=A0A3N1MDH9_9PROT|nr:LysR family transcriptional regulator [Stella humosa]ROQ01165.1 LysR family transcriptional regulator [Stella humosa]BBK31540.1 hypothetical protein STHU_21740 [Stella humosa]
MKAPDEIEQLERIVRYKTLLAFKLIVETGSMTEAAKLLGVSQPAVTQMMARLSDYMGFDLFERQSQRRLVLTLRGRSVLEGVGRCIASIEAFGSLIHRQGASMAETIVVAVASSLGLRFGQEAISHTALQFPEIQWRVEPVPDRDVSAGMVAGDFDIALSAEPSDDPSITSDHIGILPIVVAMPANHPLSRLKKIKPADLLNEELALPCVRCVSRSRIDAAFLAVGMQVHAAVEGGTEEATLGFIGQGRRVGLLSAYTTFESRSSGVIVTRLFDANMHINLHIHYRSDFHRLDLLHVFRNVNRDLSRQTQIGL